MPVHMPLHVTQIRRRIGTVGARIWPFSCVLANVNSQIALLRSAIVAVWAGIRFYAGIVSTNMNQHVIIVKVCVRAEGTPGDSSETAANLPLSSSLTHIHAHLQVMLFLLHWAKNINTHAHLSVQ